MEDLQELDLGELNELLDIETEVSDYHWELFFRITNNIVPTIFKDLQLYNIKFYVKGGKAVDAYLSEKVGSPDWDIIVDPEQFQMCVDYIIRQLEKTLGSKVKIDTQIITLNSEKGLQIGMDYKDLFWVIDVFPGNIDRSKLTLINDIPYLGLSYLIEDLKETSSDRSERLEGKKSLLPTKEGLAQKKIDTSIMAEQDKQDLKDFIETHCSEINGELMEELDELIDGLVDTVKQDTEVFSHKTISGFKSLQQDYEKLKEKTKRTKARLVELLAINDENNVIQLSKEFVLELCNFCTENVDGTFPNTNINCRDIAQTDVCRAEALV